MIDWTINIGTLIQLAAFLIGGLLAYSKFKVNYELTMSTVKKELQTLQDQLKTLSQLVTNMAVTDMRINYLEKEVSNRFSNLEDDIRSLKKGEGYIIPRELLDKN